MANSITEKHPVAYSSDQTPDPRPMDSADIVTSPAESTFSRAPMWTPEKESHRFWRHWSEDLEHIRHRIEHHPHVSVAERHRKDPVQARADLARFMGEDCKAVLRRFSALNVRTMLHLQNDLSELEFELDAVERQMATQYDSIYLSGYSWLGASEKLADGSWPHAQREIYDKIMERLPKYNKLLLQHRQLFQLQKPTKKEVDAIYRFSARQACVKCKHEPRCGHPWFSPFELSVWRSYSDDQPLERDLVSVTGEPEDRFTTFIRDDILGFFYDKIYLKIRRGRRKSQPKDAECGKSAMYVDGLLIEGSVIQRIASTITILVASVLPIVAIICLYFIQPLLWKLVFTLTWSVLLTAALHFFTTASREQIFQASIAMAAVQVVFIGTSMVQTVHLVSN